MKFFNVANKVLCLSPHSDDVEFSMGATMMKYRDTQFTSIVFSTSSPEDPVNDADRWQEVKDFWLGIKNVDLKFMSRQLNQWNEEHWIVEIEKMIDLSEYSAIFIPSLDDTHYEHRMVHNIGMALTRTTPVSIFEYCSPSTKDTWTPNMFVNIETTWAEKNARLWEAFKSQDKVYFESKYMKSFHSHSASIKKGVDNVEQFRLVTMY